MSPNQGTKAPGHGRSTWLATWHYGRRKALPVVVPELSFLQRHLPSPGRPEAQAQAWPQACSRALRRHLAECCTVRPP